MIAIDLPMAQRFLDALEPGGMFSFQTFDDRRTKDNRLARVLHGTLDDHCMELGELNEEGAGIFVTVNRTNGKGRRACDVVALRALFVDADDRPRPTEWHRTPPDIIVSRDDTHWHAYWLLGPGEDLARFESAQKALARHYGTDPKVFDLPRVMRVPGFLHCKGDAVMVRMEV